MVEFFKKRIYLVVLLVCFVLIINIPALNNSFPIKTARSAVLLVFYPFQIAFNFTLSSFNGFIFQITTLRSAQKENEIIKKELGAARLKLYNLTEIEKENRVLTQLSSFQRNLSSFNTFLVPIIGRDPANWFDLIQVNIGKTKGVNIGAAAVTYDGTVGYVIEVNPYTSKIRLLTDPDCSISGVDQNTGDIGLVIGGGHNRLFFKYISLTSNISVGDQIVTSNMSDIFPKGIPIGTVSKIIKNDYELFQYIEVTPNVNFGRLQWVLILK